MDKSELSQLLELVGEAEALRPVVKEVFAAVKSCGPEVAELVDGIADYLIDKRAHAVKRLRDDHGFSEDTAVMLTMDLQANILSRLERHRTSSKSQ